MARAAQLAAVVIALMFVLSAAGYGIVRGIQDDGRKQACDAYLHRLARERMEVERIQREQGITGFGTPLPLDCDSFPPDFDLNTLR